MVMIKYQIIQAWNNRWQGCQRRHGTEYNHIAAMLSGVCEIALVSNLLLNSISKVE